MNQLWKAAGAAAWGAAALGGLQPFLGPEAAEQLHTLCPGAQTVLVGAFPYYAGQAPGNLSLYCRGEDYHLVLGRRLEQVCAGLRARHPSHTFVAGRTTPLCRNRPRRSWPAWAAGAATGCGSSPPTAPMSS